MDLLHTKCVPCEGGTLPLTIQRAHELMNELDGWQLSADARQISKEYTFRNFANALAFVVRLGAVAEEENHHPDVYLSWGLVRLVLQTHAMNGLSLNDFVLAAKIDARAVV